MTYYILQNLKISESREYVAGDNADLSDLPYVNELILRGLVTTRPPHRSGSRDKDNSED